MDEVSKFSSGTDENFTKIYMEDEHMKLKSFKRVLALALATAMVLTACGQKPAANTSESTKASESTPATESEAAPSEKEEEPLEIQSITLYPKDANLFSGLVTGYRGEALAAHGIELEVWAYSDEKTNAMLTSGDFPDMMYIGKGGVDTLNTLIETDKIINLDDYKDQLPNIYGDNIPNKYITDNLQKVRDNFSAGTGGVYFIPTGLGESNGIYAQTGTFDRNVPKLKWDVYEAIGAPEVTDMWSLIDIAEEMLEYQPALEDGTKMFGTFLDNGLDSTSFGGLNLWYTWHGCSNNLYQYLVSVNYVNGTIETIFEEDGVYKEGILWLHELYERGLMDPDSISTARTDQAPKLDNGLAMLPAGTLPGWATKYYEVFPSDVLVYRDFTGETFSSPNNSIVIFKEAENIDACLRLLNIMADPYEWMKVYYGPEGCIWQEEGNVISITDEFAAWLKEKGSINFFPMPDGTEYSIFNTPVLFGTGVPLPGKVDINGEPLPYIPTSWPDAQAITSNNENWNAWKETMGANDLWDYTEKNGITVTQVSAFDGYPSPAPDDTMKLTLASIKDVIVPASWNMVYAESDEELEKIWDQMVEDAYALGAQDVIDWFMDVYKK